MSPEPYRYRSLALRSRVIQAAVGLPAALLVSLYLVSLLQLSHGQWIRFGLLVLAYVPVAVLITEPLYRRFEAPLRAWLEQPDEADPPSLLAALGAVLCLPRNTALVSAISYGLAGVLVGGSMKLGYPDLSPSSVAAIWAAALTGGLIANLFLFFSLKRMLEPLRLELALRIGDPDQRHRHAPRLPLGTKLLVTFTGFSVAFVFFAVLLAHVRSQRALEAHTSHLQRRLLEQVSQQQPTQDARGLDAVRARGVELGIWSELFVVDTRTGAGGERLSPVEQRVILGSTETGGDGTNFDSPHALAWRRLDDRRALVARMALADLEPFRGHLLVVFGGLLGVAALVSCLLARVAARDIADTTDALRAEADRIASGDLRQVRTVESEDELGALARAFSRMVGEMQRMVARAAEAADGVEVNARDLEAVGSEVASAAEDQGSGIAGIRASLDALSRQVAGIAQAAGASSASVEESSSSMLELKAAGEELNQTAWGLSSRVEEVSSSIEQAVRSARDVGQSTESLFEAASDTSASMEEMASSMREVDANAGEMARLSERVMETAEGGAAKVRQTIAGMHAIREATDTVQGVMQSLSGRAAEIGAIVDVIDDVADETNLLALNAAIIAAQAGEQGRAFSVVADQIKELADRVMTSTKEIGALIRAVQEESRSAQTAVEQGSRAVGEGVELSAQAGESLEAITQAAQESGSRIEEIVAAVREQTRAASHVVERMEQVREGVERIRSAGQQQAQGHEAVEGGARAIRDVVTQLHRTTQEQAQGASRIGEGLERVREAVTSIHRALEEQSAACGRAADEMQRVAEHTDSNQGASRRVAQATRGLREQAESLRRDLQRFSV